MRNCLIISAFFPPIGGVAVQRITKFVKYLPDFGWNPIVITIPTWSSTMPRDPSMLTEIPSTIKVHRPFYFDYRRVIPGDIAKLIRPLTRKYLYPDRYRLWNFFALKFIRQLLTKEKIERVFVNLSPFSTLLLAFHIKKEFDIPVIINFRDPFSFNNYLILNKKSTEIQRALDIECHAFPVFDAIVCVTPYLQEKYQSLFPEIRNKFRLITNGFDESDFLNLNLNEIEDRESFSIGYNGSVSKLVPIEPLLEAIYKIYLKQGIKIKLNIASKDSIQKILARYQACEKYGLIQYKGFLPHKESLENLCESQIVAIMFENSQTTEGAYSGKIFEYLRLDKPILLLNNKTSHVAKLIQQTNTGTCVNIDNQDEIVAAILDYYQQWKNGQLKHEPNREEIRKFDYKNLTQQLVSIFEEISDRCK